MDKQLPLFNSNMSRRDVLRYGGTLSAAAMLTATLAACSGPASTNTVATAGAKKGGKTANLTTAIGYGNNQSFDPTQTASGFLMAAINHVYEGLLENDPKTGKTYAALATSVPTDASALSWTMKLRSGAKWHDGTAVTADDVVFTFERVLDPTANVLIRPFFADWLKSVTKVDKNTVKLTFNYAFPYATQRMSIAKIMPKHVFGAAGAWDKAQAGLVVGSGPYKVTNHVPGTNTEFAAFSDYNGPRPANFATMNWLSIVDDSSRVARISGASAAAQISDNIPVANVDTLKASGLTVEGNQGMNLMYLMFDATQKPFDDKRVRQALQYAINTPKMIEVALKGTATPATSYIYESNPAYAKASTVYSYNQKKAKALLAEAGVSNLNVNLMATNVGWLVTCLPTIKESWDAIGVTTTLVPQETAAFVSKLGQPFQAAVGTSNPQAFGSDVDLLVRYTYSKGGLWTKTYMKWDDTDEAQKVYELMDKAAKETDETARNKIVHQYLDAIAEAAVYYPVLHQKPLTGWNPKKITNVTPLPYPGLNLLQARSV